MMWKEELFIKLHNVSLPRTCVFKEFWKNGDSANYSITIGGGVFKIGRAHV